MKRIWGVTLFAAFFLAAAPAQADVGSALTLLDAVATNTSVEVNVSKASSVSIQAWSTSGSVGVVTIYGRACPGTGTGTCSAPWFPLLTIANPDVQGEYWSVAQTMRLKAEVSGYGGGNITIVLETHTVSP